MLEKIMNYDELLKLKYNTDFNHYRLSTRNCQKFLGVIEKDIDGYYKYWPTANLTGYWDEEHLRLIADILKDLNKEYDTLVKQELERLDGKQTT